MALEDPFFSVKEYASHCCLSKLSTSLLMVPSCYEQTSKRFSAEILGSTFEYIRNSNDVCRSLHRIVSSSVQMEQSSITTKWKKISNVLLPSVSVFPETTTSAVSAENEIVIVCHQAHWGHLWETTKTLFYI